MEQFLNSLKRITLSDKVFLELWEGKNIFTAAIKYKGFSEDVLFVSGTSELETISAACGVLGDISCELDDAYSELILLELDARRQAPCGQCGNTLSCVCEDDEDGDWEEEM